MVVATIQSALRSTSVPPLEPPALHVEVVSPLTQEVAGVVSRFIVEISKLYVRELGANNSSTRLIREFLATSDVDPVKQYGRLSRQFSWLK